MKPFFTILLFLLAFSSISLAQNNQVVFSFDHKVGTEPLTVGETEFTIWNNKKVIITRAQFYISEVEIHLTDGTLSPLSDQYLLVNANAPTAEFELGEWPIASIQGLTLHLGVPASVNHNDPASWPSDHPLAPQNPAMHWGWSAGYRFMALEGKVDNNGDGVPETSFEFHNLFDILYKTIEFTGTKEAENGVLHLHFVLDYVKLFNEIAMTGNLFQHGNSNINKTVMTNAATQNFMQLLNTSGTQHLDAYSSLTKAFPNPANTEATLEYSLPTEGPLELILTNTLGQAVQTITGLNPTGSVHLETAKLPSGIYQYGLYQNGALLARKKLAIKH